MSHWITLQPDFGIDYHRLLEHEESVIHPYKEPLEVINLGSEEDPKEVKIGALLHPSVKIKLIELLKEYVDIFAWL